MVRSEISQPGAWPGQGRLWAGNVVCCLAHGGKDKVINWFSQLLPDNKVSSRRLSPQAGRCEGKGLLFACSARIGATLAVTSGQTGSHRTLPPREKGLLFILIIPMASMVWGSDDSGFGVSAVVALSILLK